MVQMVDYFQYHSLQGQLLNMTYTRTLGCGTDGGLSYTTVYKFLSYTYFAYKNCGTNGCLFSQPPSCRQLANMANCVARDCGTDYFLFSVQLLIFSCHVGRLSVLSWAAKKVAS